MKDKTGTFESGYAILAGLAFTGALTLLLVRTTWSRTWPAEAAGRAGIRPKGVYAAAN